ncbi:unnamed protein product [Phytomonas sp. EM1]|nr:unnamed protein product [Phytomonas sp. EM1]|eukprot:CCW63059.1 unnamed protein product [Phytomonas sp. isolate EM1]
MLGIPPPVSKDWDEMYFYEKVRHLVDKTSDFIISNADWWLPSVATGMILSVVLLGGPESTSQALGITLQSASPVIRAPPFSTPIQGPHGEKPEDPEDEF